MLASLRCQNLYGFDASIAEVWNGVINFAHFSIKNMIDFVKKIPGVDSIKETEDFRILVDNRLIDFFLVTLIFLLFN